MTHKERFFLSFPRQPSSKHALPNPETQFHVNLERMSSEGRSFYEWNVLRTGRLGKNCLG